MMQTSCEDKGTRLFAELAEFGSFSPEAQRYICRSIDVAFLVEAPLGQWARDERELEAIKLQRQVYGTLLQARHCIPEERDSVSGEAFLLPLVEASAFDISCSRLAGFADYRFLYERLLGAKIRPWLPSAFLAAVGLPYFSAAVREALVASVQGSLTDGWSTMEPLFWPRWLGDGEMLAA